MTRASRAAAPVRALTWCAAPVLGRDGRPSFAKLILIAVLALYAMNAPLPQLVAIAAIASSYGWKMFLAFLQRSTFALDATDTRTASTSAATVASTSDSTNASTTEIHETKDVTVHLEEKRSADGGFEYDPDDRSPA